MLKPIVQTNLSQRINDNETPFEVDHNMRNIRYLRYLHHKHFNEMFSKNVWRPQIRQPTEDPHLYTTVRKWIQVKFDCKFKYQRQNV